jgi:hypothetical protein
LTHASDFFRQVIRRHGAMFRNKGRTGATARSEENSNFQNFS